MRYVTTFIMASMMREAPALADKKLYSASAMATAQIEGKQHYDELERQGVLGIVRKTRIRGRLADGAPCRADPAQGRLWEP